MARRFPPEWLEQLRANTDIVQTVSAYVPLKKNGRNYWGLCPFHGEKTASFSVSPEKGFYYCFGCKATGNVIQFVMEIEHLDFSEAVTLLAERAHMPLPQMVEDPLWQQRKTERERILEANRTAAQFFHQTLYSDAGEPYLAYLRKRGLNDNVIRRFGIGAAPPQSDGLFRHLREKGFSEEELRLADLIRVQEAQPATELTPARERRVRDVFYRRVIFPIIDARGNVLGFGGRIIQGDGPKYVNTSETPVFHKRKEIFAGNLLAKERGLERAFLVEGYLDVVSLSQFGVKGVCATLGTALTNEQARLIHRFAPTIVLSYDGDSAGQHAIERGLEILAQEQIPARVLVFPDGLDPDEFIRQKGTEAFHQLKAIPPEAYRIQRLAEQYDLTTPEGKTEYARACAKILRPLDPVELEGYLQRLSVQTGFTREVLLAQIRQNALPASPETAPRPRPAPVREELPKDEALDRVRAQETLIAILASGRLPKDLATQEDFEDPLLKYIFGALQEGTTIPGLMELLSSDADRARAARILQLPTSDQTGELLEMARQCVATLQASRAAERIREIMSHINEKTGEEKQRDLAEIMRLRQSRSGDHPERSDNLDLHA